MSTKTIDASMLSTLFLAGASNLESKKEIINELNVFPVPDGDTGSNMTMTIMSAARALKESGAADMATVCQAISQGSLRGARGNSGVILSQLLRGFTKTIRENDVVDAAILADAFMRAKESAYKAVMKPKEGTILTVARVMAEKAIEVKETVDDIEEFADIMVNTGLEALATTPDLLPVLKEAGVVDSGGQGLMEVLIGVQNYLTGKTTEINIDVKPVGAKSAISPSDIDIPEQDIKFGYCTEFIIMTERKFTTADEIDMKNFLNSIGDSIVCVVDDGLVKIHVHTDHPGQAMEKALKFGELTSMKIDNLREEHREVLFKQAQANKETEQVKKNNPAKLKEYGFVAVSAGAGLTDIFKELGADEVITGGQTMNPSTDDILTAIEKIPAKNIFVLPNNGNIILAAGQASQLCEDKNVIVLPTKTVPQGITALLSFVPEDSVEDNTASMTEIISTVKTGEVTYAVRNTTMDGMKIKKNNIMGIVDGKLSVVEKDVETAVMNMLDNMVDDESSVISLYYGAETGAASAEALKDQIEEKFDECDIELHDGGQSVYYYVVSVE